MNNKLLEMQTTNDDVYYNAQIMCDLKEIAV
jgi:hypothetical protein